MLPADASNAPSTTRAVNGVHLRHMDGVVLKLHPNVEEQTGWKALDARQTNRFENRFVQIVRDTGGLALGDGR